MAGSRRSLAETPSLPRGDRSLAQALAAFSYITVPSLRCLKTKLQLYLETAQVLSIIAFLLSLLISRPAYLGAVWDRQRPVSGLPYNS